MRSIPDSDRSVGPSFWQNGGNQHPWGHRIDLRLVRISCEESGAWSAVLDQGEVDRSMSFRHQEDRDRFITGRGLLRTMLGRAAKLDPGRLVFDTNPYGKPRLPGAEGLAFNVAHSGDYVMVAIGRVEALGVDVEQHRGDMDLLALSQRIFTGVERQSVLDAAEHDRAMVFFRHWVLKEALLKGIGTGFSVDPRQIEIPFVDGRPARPVAVGPTDIDVSPDWTLHEIPVTAGYSAALAILP